MSQVPSYTTLSSVYGEGEAPKQRFKVIEEAFKKQFGAAPDHFVRSPGRVNLIGEHIDYEGYSVLPMAIGLDTVIAVKVNPTKKLRIANVNPKYAMKHVYDADPHQEVDRANHSWTNYVICGYKGVFDFLRSKGTPVEPTTGLDIMVEGRVPTGAGLSSSAALVCSSAIAVMSSMGKSFSKADVSELACVAERYVGTQSGGMDQAISVMGQRGLAKVVHFNPVRTDDVRLPAGAAFVIANSLTVSNKAETAHTRYNLRVVECRLAAMLMAKKLGKALAEALKFKTLGEVEKVVGGLEASGAEARRLLKPGAYSAAELEEEFETKLTDIFSDNATSIAVLEHNTAGFKLHDRAVHVFGEAARVTSFAAACAKGASLAELGALMDASHASCRDLYECSCAELEELIALAKENGAVGARLTGAGWGGCAVMLLPAAEAAGFVEAMKGKYFAKRVAGGVVKKEELGDCIFATEPGAGAAILKLPVAAVAQPPAAKPATAAVAAAKPAAPKKAGGSKAGDDAIGVAIGAAAAIAFVFLFCRLTRGKK